MLVDITAPLPSNVEADVAIVRVAAGELPVPYEVEARHYEAPSGAMWWIAAAPSDPEAGPSFTIGRVPSTGAVVFMAGWPDGSAFTTAAYPTVSAAAARMATGVFNLLLGYPAHD